MKAWRILFFILSVSLIACKSKKDQLMGTWYLSHIIEPDYNTKTGYQLNQSIRKGKYTETINFDRLGFTDIVYRNSKPVDTTCGYYDLSGDMNFLRSKWKSGFGDNYETMEISKDVLKIHRLWNKTFVLVFVRGK